MRPLSEFSLKDFNSSTSKKEKKLNQKVKFKAYNRHLKNLKNRFIYFLNLIGMKLKKRVSIIILFFKNHAKVLIPIIVSLFFIFIFFRGCQSFQSFWKTWHSSQTGADQKTTEATEKFQLEKLKIEENHDRLAAEKIKAKNLSEEERSEIENILGKQQSELEQRKKDNEEKFRELEEEHRLRKDATHLAQEKARKRSEEKKLKKKEKKNHIDQDVIKKIEKEQHKDQIKKERIEKLKSFDVETLNDLADKAIDQNKWKKAEEYTTYALEKDINSWRANRNSGRISAQREEYKQAKESFLKALKSKLDYAQLWYEYGKALYRLDEFKPAANAFRKALMFKRDFIQAAFNQGLSLDKIEKTDEAITAFKRSTRIDPNHAKSWYKLGDQYSKKEEYSKSVECFQRAIEIDSTNSVYYGDYGLALFESGDLENSEKAFRRSLAINAENAASNYNLANVKMQQGEYNEALIYAALAARLKPKSEYFFRAGIIAEQAGQANRAKEYYEKSSEAGGDNVGNFVNLGALYDSNGQYDKAIAVLTRAYEIDSKAREVNYNLGNAYLHKEDYSNAKQHYRNVLSEYPKDNTARYYLAIAFLKTALVSSAEEQLLKIIENDSNYYDAYFQLGKLYWRLGKKKKGSKYLSKLLKLNPSYSEVGEINKMLAELPSSDQLN